MQLELLNVDDTRGSVSNSTAPRRDNSAFYPSTGRQKNLAEQAKSGELQGSLTEMGLTMVMFSRSLDAKRSGLEGLTPPSTRAHGLLHTGQPAFCSNQTGILRADYSGSLERTGQKGFRTSWHYILIAPECRAHKIDELKMMFCPAL